MILQTIGNPPHYYSSTYDSLHNSHNSSNINDIAQEFEEVKNYVLSLSNGGQKKNLPFKTYVLFPHDSKFLILMSHPTQILCVIPHTFILMSKTIIPIPYLVLNHHTTLILQNQHHPHLVISMYLSHNNW